MTGAARRDAGGGASSGCSRAWRVRHETDVRSRNSRRWRPQGTFVPVCKEIMADLLTPVSAFLKIADHADYAFLLESVEGGEHVGRYSFLGKDPFLVLRADIDGRATVERGGRDHGARRAADVRAAAPDGGLPGADGSGSAAIHRRRGRLPRLRRRDVVRTGAAGSGRRRERIVEPAAGFMLFDTVLAFDHVRHRILIISNARVRPRRRPRGALPVRVRQDRVRRAGTAGEPVAAGAAARLDRLAMRSNVTRDQFEAAVRAAQEHIAAGDIYQVVLSQRFDAEVEAEPFTVYRALRHVNPSPYMFFVRMGAAVDRRLVAGDAGARRGDARSKRIRSPGPARAAATRRRTSALGDELKARREGARRARHARRPRPQRHRARVANTGPCACRSSWALERYSHVMHLVSIVEGRLAEDCDRLDALVVVLPGRHRLGGAQDPGDADHRRSRARPPRASTRAPSAISTSRATSTSASRSGRSS